MMIIQKRLNISFLMYLCVNNKAHVFDYYV